MTQRTRQLYQCTRLIRSCFHQLKALGDELHKDLGVTVAMRAVMESLAEDGKQTVPQVAQAKAVSRQHIQVNVDELAKARLVTFQENPGHKRSPFVALTKKGTTTFAGMRRREARILEQIAGSFTSAELNHTSDTLMKLKQSIIEVRKEKGVEP